MRKQGRLETELAKGRAGVNGVGDHDELVLPIVPPHLFAALVGPAVLRGKGRREGGREGGRVSHYNRGHQP